MSKRKVITEKEIQEFIDDLDDGDFYSQEEQAEANEDHNDEDEEGGDDIDMNIVQRDIPRKMTFQSLDEVLDESNYNALPQDDKLVFTREIEKNNVITWRSKNQLYL